LEAAGGVKGISKHENRMKAPLDQTLYPRDSRSKPIGPGLPDGGYVYVQDLTAIVHVLPDGPHMHPKVLGGAQPALYAGDLTIKDGKVWDLTNLSGTFQFDDEAGLLSVAQEFRRQGLPVESGAVRIFPADGSPPVTLE
jgi:hypothetical protein